MNWTQYYLFDCIEFWYKCIIVNLSIPHLAGNQEYYVVEDDILIYDNQDDSVLSKKESNLWAKHEGYVKIPYEIEKEANTGEISEIEKAIQEYTNKTCIRYCIYYDMNAKFDINFPRDFI